MKKVLTSIAMVALTLGGIAQEKPMVELRLDTAKPKAGNERQSIVIKTKGEKPEKMVIEVDGDKVTINGKQVDDFNGGQVNVRKYNNDVRVFEMPDVKEMLSRIRPEEIESINITRGFNAEKPRRARLGVSTEATSEKGARITEVSENSAAQKAGLQKQDIITKIDKRTVSSPSDLSEIIGDYDAKAKVDITYVRDGKTKSAKAVLDSASKATSYNISGYGTVPWGEFRMGGNMREMPNFPAYPRGATSINGNIFYRGSGPNKPRLGIEIEDLPVGEGVKVIDVEDESVAETAGLKEEDIITTINGTKVADVDAMKEQLRGAKPGDKLVVVYTRKGEQKSTTITFPKPIKKANL